MFDPKAPSSQRCLQELAAPRVRDDLLRAALVLTLVQADAEDLLTNAVVLVCDPDERPWDPARGTFMTHMRMVMKDLARQERRRARTRRETTSMDAGGKGRDDGDDSGGADRFPHPGPDPADALDAAQESARWAERGARIRERIAGDAHALAAFDLAVAGVEDAREVAARAGCTVDDVYNARRRIARHAAAVRDEERRDAAASPPARPHKVIPVEAP